MHRIQNFTKFKWVALELPTLEIEQFIIWNIIGAVIADADAALLLENMNYQNYTNGDRHIGMNTEDTIVVMKVIRMSLKGFTLIEPFFFILKMQHFDIFCGCLWHKIYC